MIEPLENPVTMSAPHTRLRTVFCTEDQRPDVVREIMRFRKRALVDEAGWDLTVAGDIERDEFDTPLTVHGAIMRGDEVRACFRLIRTDRPYLVADKFGFMAHHKPFPRSPLAWEISRLAVAGDGRPFELMLHTYSAIFHFGMSRGAQSFVAFADLAKERLVTMIGIGSARSGDPVEIGLDRFGRPIVCVAGELPMRLQGGPRFERLMTYVDRTEIEDADSLLGRDRLSA